jgi:hypothetical protein
MKRFTQTAKILVILLSLIGFNSYAQKSEMGIITGGSYYYGDIINTLELGTIKFGGSLFMRYHLSPRLAIRSNLSYAKLGASDSHANSTDWQKYRNLSFTTNIIELSGVAEYNLLEDKNKGRRLRTPFIPYVYGGLGLFYFNPKAINPVSGQEVALRPLALNGKVYSPVALCIPFGAGFRYYLTTNWQIGLDIGIRYSFSSYIDDVAGKSLYPQIAELYSDDARVLYNPNKDRIDRIKKGESNNIGGSNGKERGKNEILSDMYVVGGASISYRIWPKGRARKYGGRTIRNPKFY